MNKLLKLGQLADAKLRALGLNLTQGGEPTFVPVDSRPAEWNTAALGPQKLALAQRLAARLIESLIPGAAVILTSGKLYPGESQPRWRLALLQTPHHGPLWKNHALLQLQQANLHPPASEDPRRLIEAVADQLNLNTRPLPAYEDVTEWMRLEESHGATCPLPRFSRQENRFVVQPGWSEQDQARWQTHCQPAGWILPLLWANGHWFSPHWELPGNQELVLLPGQSPLGLRLPLHKVKTPGIKCALAAEIKGNDLRLFLPPLPSLAAFRTLLASIENVLSLQPFPPLLLEGYLPPPSEKETVRLSLTADPGVIEVNLQPCLRFAHLHALLTKLYSAAQACGLRGFKYQTNGRLTGTGGGAHVLLGGPALEKNPFVLRPHLLPSFLRFTQNHPSLSYLFSGLFVGPSCQATRIDETVSGALPELELALRSIETMPSPADPDLIDRILRNLLQDWHGNPHRTEICIDKFSYPFAPDSRLGLVEFRSVEMMPTPDMLLSIHALYRALAATFAELPYQEPLADWGNTLHDQFLLPYFLKTDFQKVLSFLRKRGFHFTWSQFQPHLDLRCPRIVDWELDGVRWEIRQALEPWPVMGNQPGPSGTTSRPVDVSTDRLQLSVRCPSRTQSPPNLVVNGVCVPFQPLKKVPGFALCALRYRRFNNTLGLQPQIPAHTPLTFDLVDPASQHILQSFHYLEHGLNTDPSSIPPSEEKRR